MQKGFAGIYILVGIVLLAVLGGVFYLVKSSVKPQIFQIQPQISVSPTPLTKVDETANWKILHLVNLSFSIPQSWSYKEKKDSLTQKAWINLYPPQASKDQKNITEKDTDVSFVINYLPNTTVLVEEQKVRTTRVIENITEGMAAASAVPPTGKGIVTGKSFYGTYTGSGPNRPKDIKITYFQYGEGVYLFEFTDAMYTFGKYYNQILSTFKFLDQENQPTASSDKTRCFSDSDCGLNICQCSSLRKELIKDQDKMCTRACSGVPKCINNQCVLDNEGEFCGGIAANLPENKCPSGYKCQLDGNYPDAGGKCVKE